VHPTQKPVRVLRHIIKIASNVNDLVFDPFMGVGSTGVACLELGRRFLGIDKNKQFNDEAQERVRIAQPSLLVEEEPQPSSKKKEKMIHKTTKYT